MAIDEGRRLRMVGRLHDVLGAEAAETLMAYVPTGGWAEMATKHDVADLGNGLRAEMAELRGDLRTEMADLRTEMGALRGDVRTELHATIGAQTRTLFLGLVAVMVAYGAGIVAAVRLH